MYFHKDVSNQVGEVHQLGQVDHRRNRPKSKVEVRNAKRSKNFNLLDIHSNRCNTKVEGIVLFVYVSKPSLTAWDSEAFH